MTYGITVTPEQLDILEENNIEYDLWDIESLMFDLDPKTIEITFDDEDEMDRARKLLKGKI